MKKYDFDTPVERRGTDSIKWDVAEGELPMWVADMDFRTAPEIIEEIERRAAHGVFGYSDVSDDWYNAYIGWWKTRHNFSIEKEWLMFCTGVIPAISSAVRKLTTPNENVVIQTPVYNIFFNSIVNNGCRVLENPLKYENGEYSVDFDDLENKLSDPQTNLMILCNPHNPVSKIWDRETLARIGELAYENGVTVISDEIHCDITKPGKDYIPFASVSDICRKISVTCVAPTKVFSIPGIQTAAIVAPDVHLRNKIRRAINTDEVAEPNVFAATVPVAAFTKGAEWVDEMRDYVFENRRLFSEYIKTNIPELTPVDGDATYLLWVDVSSLGLSSKEFCRIVRKETGLFITAGSVYGKNGEGFVRINVACPRVYLEDGMKRLESGVKYIKEMNKNG